MFIMKAAGSTRSDRKESNLGLVWLKDIAVTKSHDDTSSRSDSFVKLPPIYPVVISVSPNAWTTTKSYSASRVEYSRRHNTAYLYHYGSLCP